MATMGKISVHAAGVSIAVTALAAGCGRMGFDSVPSPGSPGSPGSPDSPDAAPGTASGAMIVAPTQNLIAAWSLDSFAGTTAADDIGAHPATCVGACPPLQPGKFGMAAAFDGTSSYCLDVSSMQSWPATAFTVSAWVSSANLDGPIVAHESSSGCPDPSLGVRSGLVGLTQLNTSTAHNEAWTNSPLANMSAWHHVAVSWDGSTQQVFVDGVCSCNAVPSYAPVPNVAQFTIGCYPGANLKFTGLIDNVRLYDRALSLPEVADLFGEGTTTAPAAISCPAQCKLTAPAGAP
jgi:hypothetical protein